MISHEYKAIDTLAGSKPVKISLVGFEGGKVGVKGAVSLPSPAYRRHPRNGFRQNAPCR
jgi:hypothetical protein